MRAGRMIGGGPDQDDLLLRTARLSFRSSRFRGRFLRPDGHAAKRPRGGQSRRKHGTTQKFSPVHRVSLPLVSVLSRDLLPFYAHVFEERREIIVQTNSRFSLPLFPPFSI